MKIKSEDQLSIMRWIFGTFILMVASLIMMIVLFITIVMEDLGIW